MKMRTVVQLVLVLIILTALWGCGSGGNQGVTAQGTQKSVLVLPAGVTVKGIDITLVLPAGATVQADPVTGETLPGVVTLSGSDAGLANSFPLGIYTPASASVPAKVRIVLISDTAFVAGEFFTVTCDVAAGVTLAPADFGYEGLVLYDAATGSAITAGVSATITF